MINLSDEEKQSILLAKKFANDLGTRGSIMDQMRSILHSKSCHEEVHLPNDPGSYMLYSEDEKFIYNNILRLKVSIKETNERIGLLDKSKLSPIDERILNRHIEESTKKMDTLLLKRVMRIVFTRRDVDNTIIDRFIQHWSKVEGVNCYISDITDVVVLW